MEYTKKFLYLSNQWYNDGLKKANIRDLSGAITSLKKSLQYNRDNVAARNLLGLVYYGRGEVVEALVEWVISKNIKSHGNIATYYIKKVQESPSELEIINQAIKKYNQCLTYCQQGGEDLAAIQLRKVVSAHPTFVRAYQLLALIYLETEQYAKARQMIRKAHKLDTTNEITLRYMHELKQMRSDKSVRIKEEKEQTVSYKLGNETIIQPISATLKDNAGMMTILNIVIGIIVGAAVVWFLFVPTIKQNLAMDAKEEIIEYSKQLAAKNTEIDLLKRELEQYKSDSEATANAMETAQNTQGSYDALITIIGNYSDANYSREKLADELLAMKPDSLGEIGRAKYDAIAKEIYDEQCKTLYESAQESFAASKYDTVVQKMERVLLMNEKYADGEAMLLLMNAYQQQEQADKATLMYEHIKELFPDSEVLQKATAAMTGKGAES